MMYVGSTTSIAALFKPSTKLLHLKWETQIVELLRRQNLTRQQIAGLLRTPINCVTAPVKALLQAGIIVEHERVRNLDTGCLNWSLRLKESD